PTAAAAPHYKEAEGWAPAAPADALERGPWWTLFEDPDLTTLEQDCAAHNQNIAAAWAAYKEARALVSETRAALFPTFTAGFSPNANGGGGARSAVSGLSNLPSGVSHITQIYSPSVGASWAPDLWGRVRRQVEAARATAEADYADFANVRLSM